MKKLLNILGTSVFTLLICSFVQTSKEWKFYFENKEVKIESCLFSCEKPSVDIHNKYVLLKITNKTNKTIEVSFEKELWSNEICTTCSDSKEFETKIILQPNEVAQADCDSKTKELKIFHSNSNAKKILTKFELKEIKINIYN